MRKLFTNGRGRPRRSQYAFRGPIYVNADASTFKTFRPRYLGEQGLQFRVRRSTSESRIPTPPAAQPHINAGTFGVLNSAASPRILQFALKLNF
jgi:hypothetical protein